MNSVTLRKDDIVFHPDYGYLKFVGIVDNTSMAEVHVWWGSPRTFCDGTIEVPVRKLQTTSEVELQENGVI